MVAAAGPGSLMERPGGRILVDVRVSDASASTLARLRASGAKVVFTDSAHHIVTVEVAPSSLSALAAVQPQVLAAEEVLQPAVNVTCPTGIVSEGDTQLKAVARRTNSVDGRREGRRAVGLVQQPQGGAADRRRQRRAARQPRNPAATPPRCRSRRGPRRRRRRGPGHGRDRPRHGPRGSTLTFATRQQRRGPVRQQHPQPGHRRRQGHRRRRHLLRRADVPGRQRRPRPSTTSPPRASATSPRPATRTSWTTAATTSAPTRHRRTGPPPARPRSSLPTLVCSTAMTSTRGRSSGRQHLRVH